MAAPAPIRRTIQGVHPGKGGESTTCGTVSRSEAVGSAAGGLTACPAHGGPDRATPNGMRGCPILAKQGWGTDRPGDGPTIVSLPHPSPLAKDGAPVQVIHLPWPSPSCGHDVRFNPDGNGRSTTCPTNLVRSLTVAALICPSVPLLLVRSLTVAVLICPSVPLLLVRSLTVAVLICPSVPLLLVRSITVAVLICPFPPVPLTPCVWR